MLSRTGLNAAMIGALALGALPACQQDSNKGSTNTSVPDADVGLKLDPSSRTITAGEIATVAARTENLLGRDAAVRWSAPGGDLHVEQNGRIARAHYEQPGTYTITAQLFIDEHEVRRDQTTVKVNPLP